MKLTTIIAVMLLPVTIFSSTPGSFSEMLDVGSLPQLKHWQSKQASGYDRGDGFYDSGNFIREEPGKRFVMMEADGPGCIDRIWMTRKDLADKFDILVFIDNKETPAISMDMDELWMCNKGPFVKPFLDYADRAMFCYVPIGFQKSCKVLLHPTGPDSSYVYRKNSAGEQIYHVYYQISYRVFDKETQVKPFSWRMDEEEKIALEKCNSLWNNVGNSPYNEQIDQEQEEIEIVLNGSSKQSLFKLNHAGTIQSLKLKVSDPKAAGDLWLQMTWDAQEMPAVNVPLTAYFGAQDLNKDAIALWMGISDGWYYSYYPMPFFSNAKISIQSKTDVDVTVNARILYNKKSPNPDAGLFHASRFYEDDNSLVAGQDYTLLNTQGHGHIVAVNMDHHGDMEGDDHFFINGEDFPSIYGTGTEDFFNFAWGFGFKASYPLHGLLDHFQNDFLYRIMIPGAIAFNKSILITCEHGSGSEAGGTYSGAVLYYLKK